MVDYKLIADNDPDGNLEVAFGTMSIETINTAPEVMVTYRRISASVGLQESIDLEAAVITHMPDWINNNLAFDGININDPRAGDVLISLIGEVSANKIIEMGVVKVLKYNGLKIGHLANARRKRLEGKI